MSSTVLRVEFKKHDVTGLIVAYSPDHKGFMVHGRTLEEVESRIPGALRALLAAEGKKVLEVRKLNNSPKPPSTFFPPDGVRFEAELTAA